METNSIKIIMELVSKKIISKENGSILLCFSMKDKTIDKLVLDIRKKDTHRIICYIKRILHTIKIKYPNEVKDMDKKYLNL
jgi:hypothetical protein